MGWGSNPLVHAGSCRLLLPGKSTGLEVWFSTTFWLCDLRQITQPLCVVQWDGTTGDLNEQMGKPRTRKRREGFYLKPRSKFRTDPGEFLGLPNASPGDGTVPGVGSLSLISGRACFPQVNLRPQALHRSQIPFPTSCHIWPSNIINVIFRG